MRQELESKTQSLQQYIDQLKALKAQSPQQTALQIISPPEMLEDSTGKIKSIEADDQTYAGAIAALGILLGVGAIVGPDLVGSVIKRAGLQKVRQVPEWAVSKTGGIRGRSSEHGAQRLASQTFHLDIRPKQRSFVNTTPQLIHLSVN